MSPRSVQKENSPPRGPRTLLLRRSENGYGFTLRHFIVYPPESCCVSISSRGRAKKKKKKSRGKCIIIRDGMGTVDRVADAAGTRADQDRRAYGHDLREASAGEFAGGRGGIAHRRPRRLRRRDANAGRAVRQRGATHSASGTVATPPGGLQGGRYSAEGKILHE